MPDQIPTICQIVQYTLNEVDADQVNRRRSGLGGARADGTMVHMGNRAEAGQQRPLLITQVWGDTPDSAVNGQVFLDGNDVLWVTSRNGGDGPGHWSWPARR